MTAPQDELRQERIEQVYFGCELERAMARPYESRISVDDAYLEAAGQVLFNYAYVEGVVAYLVDTVIPGYINLTRGRTADEIASDLELSSNIKADEELRVIATRFRALTERRDALLLALPVTGSADKAQILSTLTNVAEMWDEQKLWALAQEADTLAADSRNLLAKKIGK